MRLIVSSRCRAISSSRDLVMSGEPIGVLVTERGKHRLHDRLWTLLVCTVSVATAMEFHERNPLPYPAGSFAAVDTMRSGFNLRLPLHGVVEASIRGQEPNRIEIEMAHDPKVPEPPAPRYSGFRNVLAAIISHSFVDFFRAHEAWLQDRYGTDHARWPKLPITQFCRVVSNSVAHGNKLRLKSPGSMRVEWRGVAYDFSRNGDQVLFGDLSAGDIIVLMFDVSEELDALSVPHL
jgi:hypothetical protein